MLLSKPVAGLSAALMMASASGVQAQPATDTTASPTVAAAVAHFAAAHGTDQSPSFRSAKVDINRDGRADAVVLLSGPDWCGSGGCTLLVLGNSPQGLRVVGDTGVSSAPIRVLQGQSKGKGWATLIVRSEGRGDVVLRHGAHGYPDNASEQPKASPAQIRAARIVLR